MAYIVATPDSEVVAYVEVVARVIADRCHDHDDVGISGDPVRTGRDQGGCGRGSAPARRHAARIFPSRQEGGQRDEVVQVPGLGESRPAGGQHS
jgi:hypothetical protein